MRTVLPLVLIAVTACAPEVKGSGNRITEPRDLSVFERLENRTQVDVRINPEGVTETTLTCDDNVLDLIDTTVKGGRLVVDTGVGVRFVTAQPCVLDVFATKLVEVVAAGSGDVTGLGPFDDVKDVSSTGSGALTLSGVRGKDLGTLASGSGDLTLTDIAVDSIAASGSGSGATTVSGAATTASLTGSGSGDVNLSALPVTTASVALSGSGAGWVNVSGSVSGAISGSGDLHVTGGGEVTVSTSGSGQVIEE